MHFIRVHGRVIPIRDEGGGPGKAERTANKVTKGMMAGAGAAYAAAGAGLLSATVRLRKGDAAGAASAFKAVKGLAGASAVLALGSAVPASIRSNNQVKRGGKLKGRMAYAGGDLAAMGAGILGGAIGLVGLSSVAKSASRAIRVSRAKVVNPEALRKTAKTAKKTQDLSKKAWRPLTKLLKAGNG